MIACVCSFKLLFKYLRFRPNLIDLFGKTIVSTIIMAFVILISKYVFNMIGFTSNIATLIIIFMAMCIYLICIFRFKTFSDEQILELPMGRKIYRFVSKFTKN